MSTYGEIPKIGFVSLGCPKALVDSERILTSLRADGYQTCPSYNEADLVVVNTCGFIDSAKIESLDAISEALKENGRVVVTGCLGKDENALKALSDSVLAITGPHQYEAVLEAVRAHAPMPKRRLLTDPGNENDIKLTPAHYGYLKISEGCNNKCSFCIIPSLRGKLVSRSIDSVMAEAEKLVDAGLKELLIISQDTSAYGSDIGYKEVAWHDRAVKSNFYDLCKELSSLGIWVRLHYVYPYPHVDKIVSLMSRAALLPYLDIPFQHASARVLKAMRRPAASQKILERISAWREVCPELVLRSTFIVGFPGETEADFQELLEFLDEARLERVGCFEYSPVEGAKANEIKIQVPDQEKKRRRQELMELQASISADILQKKVGTKMTVLIDENGGGPDNHFTIARSYADAPEIDGVVKIVGASQLVPGQFADVVVEGADEHDLYASVIVN